MKGPGVGRNLRALFVLSAARKILWMGHHSPRPTSFPSGEAPSAPTWPAGRGSPRRIVNVCRRDPDPQPYLDRTIIPSGLWSDDRLGYKKNTILLSVSEVRYVGASVTSAQPVPPLQRRYTRHWLRNQASTPSWPGCTTGNGNSATSAWWRWAPGRRRRSYCDAIVAEKGISKDEAAELIWRESSVIPS